MIRRMDWLMMFPPVVSAVGNLGALAMQAVAERLLAILTAFLIGGVGVCAVAALAWLSLKRALLEAHLPLGAAPRLPAGRLLAAVRPAGRWRAKS
jgi:hypothetical protein